jgi:hypothetical protein
MTTEAVEGGLSVRERDVEIVEGAEGMLELAAAAGEAVSMVVSPEGEIVRFEGIDKVASMPERIAKETGREIAPEMEAALAPLSDPAIVEASMIEEWSLFVGAWVGAAGEIGDVFESTNDTPVEGEEEGVSFRWSIAGKTPCTPQEQALRCVRLETVSIPDTETVSQVLRQMFRPIFEPHGIEFSFKSFETQAVLVADPDGLIPYRFERQQVAIVQAHIDGQTADAIIDEVRIRTYHHP